MMVVNSPRHLHPDAVDWAHRCVTNGAAQPTDHTVHCASEFWVTMTVEGVAALLNMVNMFVPDELIACDTPLKVGDGTDPWTRTGFVPGDLTVNGLLPPTTTGNDFYDTGFNPNTVYGADINDYSFSVVTTEEPVSTNMATCGSYGGVITSSNQFYNRYAAAGRRMADAFHGSARHYNVVPLGFVSYMCNSKTKYPFDNFMANWYGESVGGHYLASGTNVITPNSPPDRNNYVFGMNNGGAKPPNNGRVRISYLAYGYGVTEAQSEAQYNAVQRLRGQLGGGTV